MSTEPEMTSKTNPIMGQILARYVGAESVGSGAANGTDWYNMTCPRCPWFIDGAKTGQCVQVSGDAPGDAPENAPVAGNDADGDSGRATGDSGRADGDDTPWDEEWDELLDGVNAECSENEDIIGRDGRQRVPFVQCIRPESAECLNESICVQLIVAGDLIRQQAAVQKMMNDIESHVRGDNSEQHKLTKRARRSLTLRRASKKRGR